MPDYGRTFPEVAGDGDGLGVMGQYVLLEPSHIVMKRKMMLGIKAQAEDAIASQQAAAEGLP